MITSRISEEFDRLATARVQIDFRFADKEMDAAASTIYEKVGQMIMGLMRSAGYEDYDDFLEAIWTYERAQRRDA